MKGFISLNESMQHVLKTIVSSHELHAKWLNTLSYLENCGARKIAACEHSTLVKEEMLKHAAEEFRHAHYLKKQIKRVSVKTFESYALQHILGGTISWHYLNALDVYACRYLKQQGYDGNAIKDLAYLLVTFAIELRADELYRLYDEVLKKIGSKVTVKSILLEEKGHLNEMREGLQKHPLGFVHAEAICAFEGALCQKWLASFKI